MARPSCRITLMTRITTPNAGNEALSIELIKFFRRELPDVEFRAIDRYPIYLAHYKLRTVQAALNKLDLLDQHADFLIKHTEAQPTRELASSADESLIRLVQPSKEHPSVISSMKRLLGFRRNLARVGLIGWSELSRAVGTVAQSDVLVWNPAGELHTTGSPDEVFRLLLMVRLAQRLGKRTVIVNHSLEISDALLRELVSYVYGHADFVIVRDSRSYREALNLGISKHRLREAPDIVFLTANNPPTESTIQLPDSAPIGLSLNGVEANIGTDEWDILLSSLARLSRPLVFVSNAIHRDRVFAKKLQRRYQMKIIERQPSYTELQSIYSNFAALISSRLHSSILAIIRGTPVISIEPSVFKLTAVLEQMCYPYETEDPRRPGWADRVVSKVEHALTHRQEVSAFGRAAAIAQAQRVREGYSPVLSLMQGTP
jgi:polysaccharide pyruvyl transferase WcaK-like protein